MSRAMQFKAIIKNLALKNHIPAQAVMQNFMLERLLERIATSKYKNQFVLKGGLLIASMVGINNRTTMDLDATMRDFPLSHTSIRTVLLNICSIQLDDDINLKLERIMPIREDNRYGGYRASVMARFESISTPLKLDITCGDILTPNAIRHAYHSFFENKTIEVWAYNLETILAEKIETILRRSVLNTRPRDYYDVYIINKKLLHAIDKELLVNALKATAKYRESLSTLNDKEKIIPKIRLDPQMRKRWELYCKENYYANGIEWDEVMNAITDLLGLSQWV